MEDDDVERMFASMAFNNYTDSMNDFIEWTRIQHLRIQEAIANDEHERAGDLATEMFMAANRIQLGNVVNLVSGYAGALFRERAATVELHDLLEAILARMQEFHAHLVYVNQPNEELIMVTDMIADLRRDMDNSAMGQTLKNSDG